MNYIFNNDEYKNKLLERFLRYVKIWTESDSAAADQGIFPSTQRQFDLARLLEKELKELGLKEVHLNKDCYLYAYLPARGRTMENKEPFLLMAHMDTVDEVTGKDVKPVISRESGADGKNDIIVHSDGTTLLGSDDKSGVSAIMTALEYICKHPEFEHGPVEVMFSPDEETGHGMDRVPLELIKSKYAYTVDGGEEGELESECFNAWAANVEFTGKACHTGDAKAHGMINANLMAAHFASQLPLDKRPETTDGYQGFIALLETKACIESAGLYLLLRAFNIEEIEEEKELLQQLAQKTQEKFGGQVKVSFKQQYLNMKSQMDKHPQVVERLRKAYEEAGVKIIEKPIRGGTDGSRLTEMGIPTPNIFTGGHEFHSRNEWVSLNSLCKTTDVLINLMYT